MKLRSNRIKKRNLTTEITFVFSHINATLIAYDNNLPILSTDPWFGDEDDAYFGSWTLSHEIPNKYKKDILNSEYIWFSHGHPDHLNPDSIHKFKKNKIILGDHVGKRIFKDLKAQGFDVLVLKERSWINLSKNVSVMSISTKIQDTILLIKIKDDIFINLNDAGPMSYRFIKKVIKYRTDNKLTQKQFANRLNIPQATISALESNKAIYDHKLNNKLKRIIK